MSVIVFFLEEASAKAMLEGLMPRLLPPGLQVQYIVFEGKQDLEKQIVKKLRVYLVPHARFVILRDKDSSDCIALKNLLRQKCIESGKPDALIRLACHKLESWYLADLQAVEVGLNIANLSSKQNKAKYRNPDLLANADEELSKLSNGIYQKVGGSRAIGPHLVLSNTRSKSFSVFVKGINKVIQMNQEDSLDATS